MIHDASFHCCFSHEVFVLFAPQRRYRKHPADFSLDYRAHLFSELSKCLVRDETK